ncbi:HNH endonuclease [Corynebacterium ulceribovis]|uniref:HNH endonuclease n=1 Tax=Corynebacterium ulceribovis TaxID=487732 RepID=UPI000378ACD1|nr:HNH endonuclease [Corynebacterium ulceribovis]
MAWQRTSDTINEHPVYSQLMEIALERNDPRLVGEIRGYVDMLYTWSALNFSDYVVPYGAAAKQIGPLRVDEAMALMEQIGVAERVHSATRKQWKLMRQEEFINLITRDERMMKAKRRRDQNRGGLIVPVLLRDGDHCRYCGTEVNWKDNKNDAGGTFDHREPEKETTPENFVVSCRACNRARADLPLPDAELPLMEVPEVPVYGDVTRQKLARWKSVVARTCLSMGIDNPLTGERYSNDMNERPVPVHVSVEPPAHRVSVPSTNANGHHRNSSGDPEPGLQPVDPRLAGDTTTQDSDVHPVPNTSLPASKAAPSTMPPSAPRDNQSQGEPRDRDASASRQVSGTKRRRRRKR